jgi:hypothetical protein
MLMALPVKITRDLRVIAPADAPPLSGSQLIELGKRFLEKGCIQVALETVEPRRPQGRGKRAVAAAARDSRLQISGVETENGIVCS